MFCFWKVFKLRLKVFSIFCSLLLSLWISLSAFGQFGDPLPRHPMEMDGFINMKSGLHAFSETDISVPGRGLNLEFTRYYNGDGISRDSVIASTYIGSNWSHTPCSGIYSRQRSTT